MLQPQRVVLSFLENPDQHRTSWGKLLGQSREYLEGALSEGISDKEEFLGNLELLADMIAESMAPGLRNLKEGLYVNPAAEAEFESAWSVKKASIMDYSKDLKRLLGEIKSKLKDDSSWEEPVREFLAKIKDLQGVIDSLMRTVIHLSI